MSVDRAGRSVIRTESQHPGDPSTDGRAGYATTLTLTVCVALACCLLLISPALLLVHPDLTGLRAFAKVVNQQNQTAKTALYLAAFAVILPLALIAVPRLADSIARGPNGRALVGLVTSLDVALVAAIVLVRLSADLPWGDGLGVVLAATCAWSALAIAVLARAARPTPWPLISRLSGIRAKAPVVTCATLLAAVLCVTDLKSLDAGVLAVGLAVVVGVLVIHQRVSALRPGRLLAGVADMAVVVLLLLAVPDTVIFRTSTAIPNAFFEPGIIQFQQDWILGPANQLLGGGALLVSVPVSQYGVGMLYFLAGWFHLAPIGYGTFGALDGILTALSYAASYGLLRIAGVSRLLASAALAVAVAALIYNLRYPVGALPEQGPLRFGLPIAVIMPLVAAARWPRRGTILRAVALAVLAASSIWALEAFAYTVMTFAAMTAVAGLLGEPDGRSRFLVRQASLAVAACIAAHLTLAGATLAATGHLPAWGRYLAFLHALLLGGKEGSITYGFDHWSPGLGVGAACLGSAAAVVLLIARAPAAARRERAKLTALAGTTAYAIALFSYTDNRSATYLLLYVALPVILAATLWLGLLLKLERGAAAGAPVGGLAVSLSVVVLLIAAAWPSIGGRFLRSALAHAYPGGGLRAAVHRLWHPPPIDPRAREGARLLARDMRGPRPLVVLPAAQDLSIEILMQSHRANRLFIGDGYMDSFVPSAWMPVIRAQIAQLRVGDRLLIDRTAQAILAAVRAHPSIDLFDHPIDAGASQEEWILQQIGERFDLRTIDQDRQGLVVAQLAPRTG